MTKLHWQGAIVCVGLASAGLVAATGNDGWGWILMVTLLVLW